MDKKSKKNLIIRIVVYSTLVIATFFLIWFIDKNNNNYLKPHKLWMKIQGIEFCETPQEAIQRYAEALIKEDRDEALKYVAKSEYSENWERNKKGLYSRNKEELKAIGEGIKKGWMEEESFEKTSIIEWKFKYYLKQKDYLGILQLWYGSEGWRIH